MLMQPIYLQLDDLSCNHSIFIGHYAKRNTTAITIKPFDMIQAIDNFKFHV